MREKNILIVDDDTFTTKLLKSVLEKNGYCTLSCGTGEKGLELIDTDAVDAIILDVVLPGIDGFETLRRIRNHPRHMYMPVLMLTSKSSEIDSVLGLEMGADDYLTKPVRYFELIARLKNIFRKLEISQQRYATKIVLNNLEIDRDNRTAFVGDNQLQLSYKEFELLLLLAKNPGRVFTREELLDKIWHDEYTLVSRTVDVHIRRLRASLEESGLNPDIIETVRSIGYRMAYYW